MKFFGLKVFGSLFAAMLLSAILATSALAAPPTPTTPSGGPGYGFGGYGMMMGGLNLNGVAKLLGITTTELYAQMRQGKTLVQIANGKVGEADLINTLVAPLADQLKLRVKYEWLTQEQADAALAQAKERAKANVNGTVAGGLGVAGCGGPGMMGGFGGPVRPGGIGAPGTQGSFGRLGRW